MNLGVLNRTFLICFLTLSVNILLFTGLPNILSGESVQSDIESVQTVDFLRTGPESRHSPKPQTPKETPPPEPPKTIPRKAMKAMTPSPASIKMDTPSFNFDVAPDINPGVALSAPVEPAAAPAVLPSAFKPEKIFGLREVDQTPVAVIQNHPEYPYRARRLNIDGEVDVKFLVDKEGGVSRISILSARPPKIFDQSVLRALSLWRFAPGKVKGSAVNTWVTTTIAFKLDDL